MCGRQSKNQWTCSVDCYIATTSTNDLDAGIVAFGEDPDPHWDGRERYIPAEKSEPHYAAAQVG